MQNYVVYVRASRNPLSYRLTSLPQQMSRSVYVATGDDALDHAVEQELNELGPEAWSSDFLARYAACALALLASLV